MPIGTSLGGYYEDEADHVMQTIPKELPDINDVPHHDWVENTFKAVKDAVTLPGDVMSGKTNPTSDEGIDRSMSLAELMVGGSVGQGTKATLGSGMVLPKGEAVKSAALKYGEEVVEGQNHGMALNTLTDKYGESLQWKKIADGFTTTHGRFISREDAFKLADAQKQIDPKVMQDYNSPKTRAEIDSGDLIPMLLSEDLVDSVPFKFKSNTGKNPIDLEQIKKDKETYDKAYQDLIR